VTAPVRVTLWPLMNWLIVRMESSFLNVGDFLSNILNSM
jgi:hypothetical protein